MNPTVYTLHVFSCVLLIVRYVRAQFELAAIYGSIWGIVLSLALCILAIFVFKPHGMVIGITVGLVVANLFAVLAAFRWSGWKLGGIEAVALSILVGE